MRIRVGGGVPMMMMMMMLVMVMKVMNVATKVVVTLGMLKS